MDVAKARLVREEPPEGLTEVGREVFIDGLVAGIEQDLGGRGVYGIEVPLGLLLAAADAHGVVSCAARDRMSAVNLPRYAAATDGYGIICCSGITTESAKHRIPYASATDSYGIAGTVFSL